MCVKILLAAWSCAGLLWWLISWRLVVVEARRAPPLLKPREKKSLTLFKPLPPLKNRGLAIEARGLESFIAQLDEESEMLLGVHEADWPEVMPFIQRMQSAYPRARLVAVRRSEADTLPNPKIAWQKVLAPQARGRLWLWSDADIVAAPGFLDQARAEFETCGTELLTFPYAIRALPHPPSILDALFVNAEFYPGVLLLRRLGPVHFGLGAAMLFSRDSFLRKADWQKLGSSLADDFMLGQILRPVHLGSATLETVADATGWRAAFTHYFRWKKTVCWCQPAGFAAQIFIMPLLGWMVFILGHPANLLGWIGFSGIMQTDVLTAALICRELGCPLKGPSLLAAEAWSLCRVFFWIVCWLPGPVKWREKCWRQFQEPS
ncbi:MAG TPA: glycosyltransferase [Candidatus Methylacidiphilales bacterium]|nr:glycosyltransferase [Candidatus Methylacidiphilales bacterium]